MRKTKIICTIGPASENQDTLKQMILGGMDIARLNFSHGNQEWHGQIIEKIRALSKSTGKLVGIIQDLCGPRLRIGIINQGKRILNKNDICYFDLEDKKGSSGSTGINSIPVSHKELVDSVQIGHRILIADGTIELKVRNKTDFALEAVVVKGGTIASRKGINVPDTPLPLESFTVKDMEDLKFGLANGVDIVALSFVRTAADLDPILEIMDAANIRRPVIAKIEMAAGVDNIDEITDRFQGIMVARGDLGIELPMEQVPVYQKNIIRLCNRKAVPVITATQMLESMINSPYPTRAETSDVANAILDGTDAIMLSGETAAGCYPVEAVTTMSKIAEFIESSSSFQRLKASPEQSEGMLDTISRTTCELSDKMNAGAILTCTSSGRSARFIAKYRPQAKIIAAVETDSAARQLKLLRGVYPVINMPENDTDRMIENAVELSISQGLIHKGDFMIVTAGIPAGTRGSTNMVKVHIPGCVFLRGVGTGAGKEVDGTALILKKQGYSDIQLILSEKAKSDKIILISQWIPASFVEKLKDHISGFASEDGNIPSVLSDTLIRASIPSVLGVSGLLKNIKDGDRIRLDTKRGIILFK